MSESENSEEKPVELNEQINLQSVVAESRNPWELLRQPLRDQLKMSGNVLWSEAAKCRYRAAKLQPLYQAQRSTARLANLGSLSNLPKPNMEFNKRLCVVYGDLCSLKTDAYIVPLDDSELAARIASLAGDELPAALKRLALPPGECGQTEAFKLSRDGFPQHLLHCNVPKAEDPVLLKQAYDRAFYNADYEGIPTLAVGVMSGIAYPRPGVEYYPLIGAIHVMLSAIRQSFEKAKSHQFNLVCIVVQNEREKAVVNELMDLYFPHDPDNELEDDLKEDAVVEVATDKKKKKSAKGKRKSSGKKK